LLIFFRHNAKIVIFKKYYLKNKTKHDENIVIKQDLNVIIKDLNKIIRRQKIGIYSQILWNEISLV